MHRVLWSGARLAFVSLALLVLMSPAPALASFYLGPEELVMAGADTLDVIGSSAPDFTDWDNDGLPDLVIGEGGCGYGARVRVYLNVGLAGAPLFDDFTYVQSEGDTLTLPADG